MRAKKSYGQHFLTNEHYAQRIADSLIHTEAYGAILEVGPGQGMLTKYLLEKELPLKVVEADPDMVAYLQAHYPDLAPRIIAGNFLRVPLEEHFTSPFALIGNFPYNISSQILLRTVEYRRLIPEMVGMFQKEVAERVVAGPGSKTYGVIGVLVQAFYEPEYLFGVSKGNFNPPPKVQSAVIRLTRRDVPLLSEAEWPVYRQVVKLTFGQRRKMLRNTLKSVLPKESLTDAFFQQRPEQLSLQDFVELTRRVMALREEEE
ncbi:MAG: ribosomal RNA small subunit methyltransferase A [Lewinella sp.]|nr:ribosomal RNA small subunit methyltransferase A [Lewinella sp.]